MAEPFLGQISIFAFGFPPRLWTPCAGPATASDTSQLSPQGH